MKVYIILIDGGVLDRGYTSLSRLCKEHNLGYSSAIKGKRIFVKDKSLLVIYTVDVVRIEGRGNSGKFLIN